jgi:hypothetical protein
LTEENNAMRVLAVKLGCALALALWGLSVPIVKAGAPPEAGSEQGQLAVRSACGLATPQVPAQATAWDAAVSQCICLGGGFQAKPVPAPALLIMDDPQAKAGFVNSGVFYECQAPAGLSKWCNTDCMWLQLTAGAVFSPTRGIGPHDEPTLNLAPLDVRLGLMLNEPHPQRHWFAGVFDIIVDFTTEPVLNGFGNIVVGPAALLRYDFVRPGWGLIPYLQGGGGIVYNDCYHDAHQNAVGQSGEFLLRVDLGVHYPLGPKWSIDAEFNFVHISNADLAPRNAGVNALGASIGLTYFFRR